MKLFLMPWNSKWARRNSQLRNLTLVVGVVLSMRKEPMSSFGLYLSEKWKESSAFVSSLNGEASLYFSLMGTNYQSYSSGSIIISME